MDKNHANNTNDKLFLEKYLILNSTLIMLVEQVSGILVLKKPLQLGS